MTISCETFIDYAYEGKLLNNFVKNQWVKNPVLNNIARKGGIHPYNTTIATTIKGNTLKDNASNRNSRLLLSLFQISMDKAVNDIVTHLKKYVKDHKFDQKYKKSIYSYPTLDIKQGEPYTCIQIANSPNGIMKNIPYDVKVKLDKGISVPECDNSWYSELCDEVNSWIKKNKSSGHYSIYCTKAEGSDDGCMYVHPTDSAIMAIYASESYLDFAYEGFFDLFKKKNKDISKEVNISPLEHTPECKKHEEAIADKTVVYLKKYIRDHKFAQKYKKSTGSYSTLNIEAQPDDGYLVQISDEQDGISFDKAIELQDKLKHKGSINDIIEKYPDVFDNSWYYELLKVGEEYVKSIKLDGYEIQTDTGDGDEGCIFIKVMKR